MPQPTGLPLATEQARKDREMDVWEWFSYSFIHQSSAFSSFILNTLITRGSPTTLYIKEKRIKTLNVFLLFTKIRNKRQKKGESAYYGWVPFISFAFSNSGLFSCVRAMINYLRAAFSRSADSAASRVRVPFACVCAIFSSKTNRVLWNVFCRMTHSGLKGS